MNKTIKTSISAAALALLAALPLAALAHEHQTFRIGNATYEFTVGSLNEPIAVDDKTGVYLKVVEVAAPASGAAAAEEDHNAANGAVEGLDKTLKVEMSAGDKKKTMDLTPIHGETGAYRASFIPTVQTTYAYRFFGNVSGTPIDVSFTCNTAGHPVSPEDTNPVKLSDEVTQLKKTGAFGCPAAKTDLGFPESVASEYELAQKTVALETMQADLSATSKNMNMLALVVAVLGLAIGVGAWLKGRSV